MPRRLMLSLAVAIAALLLASRKISQGITWVKEQSAAGVGVFTVNGKMIDVAFIPGAERTLRLAKACGMYEGDLV